jgi:hypothetical protein
MRQYMYSSHVHVLYLGFTQVIWTHGSAGADPGARAPGAPQKNDLELPQYRRQSDRRIWGSPS